MNLKIDLQALSADFKTKISQRVTALEKELTEELIQEMQGLCKKHDSKYVGYCGEDGEDGIEFTAELFVNNHLIQRAIWNDPSSDWDGGPRVKDLSVFIKDGEGDDRRMGGYDDDDT